MFATNAQAGAVPLSASKAQGYRAAGSQTIDSARQLVAQNLSRQARQTHQKQPAMPAAPEQPARRPAPAAPVSIEETFGLKACLKSFGTALLETVGIVRN